MQYIGTKPYGHCLRARRACAHSTCADVSRLLAARKVLQWLPPAAAVVAHAEVAALLNDEAPAVMAIAAHTLACLGPEAVCEHFEEVCAIADEEADCCAAAWLCVSLLLPRHLLRLAARGAPVWEALTDSSSAFLRTEATEGLLGGCAGPGPAGGAPLLSHDFPEVEDVRRSLAAEMREMRGILGPEGEPVRQAQRAGLSGAEGGAAGHGAGEPPPQPSPPQPQQQPQLQQPPLHQPQQQPPLQKPPLQPSSSALDLLQGPAVQDLPSQLGAFRRVELVWSPATHAAFPPPARARARAVLRLRYELGARYRVLAVPSEVWLAGIMPLVVQRRSMPDGVGEVVERISPHWGGVVPLLDRRLQRSPTRSE